MGKTAIRYYRHTIFIKRLILLVLLLIRLTCASAEAVSITPLSMIGTVEVLPEGNQQWVAFQKGMELQAGDRIRTGEGGEIDLWCEDGSELHFGEKTQLAIEAFDFNDENQQRTFRFRLLQGIFRAYAIQLGTARFAITDQSLKGLRGEKLPETIIARLAALKGQEFPTEEALLETVRTLLDGPLTVRYALHLTHYANPIQNVFEIHTENATIDMAADMPSAVTVAVAAEPLRTQISVQQGHITTHKISENGQIIMTGLTDAQEQEGLQFLLDRNGGQARIKKDTNRLSVRSTVPLSDFQVLFGGIYQVVNITNGTASPLLTVRQTEALTVELKADEAALLIIPLEQFLSVEFSDIMHCMFEFHEQPASLVIVQEGCPRVNGKETCDSYVSLDGQQDIAPSGDIEEFRTEERTIPPAPESPNPQGSFASDSSPEISGSPIQPLR